MAKKRGMFRHSVRPATDAVGHGMGSGGSQKMFSSHQLNTTKGHGRRGAVSRQTGGRKGRR